MPRQPRQTSSLELTSAEWEVVARLRLARLQDAQQREAFWYEEAVKWRSLAMDWLKLAEQREALYMQAMQERERVWHACREVTPSI